MVVESARLFHQPLEVIERDLTRMTDDSGELPAEADPGPAIRRPGWWTAATAPKGLKLGRAPDLVGEIVQGHGEPRGDWGGHQQAAELPGDDQPQAARAPGPADPFRERRGQELSAGHRSGPVPGGGPGETDLPDRPGTVLPGRGLVTAQSAGAGGAGRSQRSGLCDAQLDFRPQAGDRNHREESADGQTGNAGQHGAWPDGRLPNHHQPAHRRGDPQPVHPGECR